MPYVDAPGRRLYYESFGSDDDPMLLLINGITSQLTLWPEDFCEAFVDRGFFVVRYDNRDCGLSTVFTDDVAYTLDDMADDAAAVIGQLDGQPAHVFGMSMGGMIAMLLAVERPELCATIVSYASTTGNPEVGSPTPEALAAIMRPPAKTREEAMANGLAGKRVWGTPDTWDETQWAEFSGDNWERSAPDGGGLRQLAAMARSGNLDDRVRSITVPSLVIHGERDTLIDPSGGRHAASLIDGAEYVEIEGVGHDLPVTEWPQIVQLVTAHAASNARAG